MKILDLIADGVTNKELLKQFRSIQTQIQDVENELTERILPYAHLVEELDKIPGIDKILSMGIIAEASTDMSAFADERKFAAWVGRLTKT